MVFIFIPLVALTIATYLMLCADDEDKDYAIYTCSISLTILLSICLVLARFSNNTATMVINNYNQGRYERTMIISEKDTVYKYKIKSD